MAKFFVGQRVRIISSKGWPELAGEEGRIIGDDVSHASTERSEWQVAPDIWGSDRSPYKGLLGGYRFAPNSDQLEPILPEGAEPLGYSFEKMMSEFGVTEAVK